MFVVFHHNTVIMKRYCLSHNVVCTTTIHCSHAGQTMHKIQSKHCNPCLK